MDLNNIIGFGIAGNFAGHLEQAGELKEFLSVSAEEGKPKGIFPFYLPEADSELSVYPYSNALQKIPQGEQPQLEPEILLLCDMTYSDEGEVESIEPSHFTVFNDCTLRKEGAKKISEKKNWGSASKGVSDTWLPVDRFDEQGILNDYWLASFVERDGVLFPYGINTKVSQYSLFNRALLEWIVDTMNNQADEGPLEDLHTMLEAHGFPKQCVMSIGATAYEEFGEKNYLMAGDILTVVAYPSGEGDIQLCVKNQAFPEKAAVVSQTVSIA
ncbi:DUF5718 family protein [Vibrio albus]|uniref:DUF5718 family protein n=1 Tax=Vibrio albus TaxID=2200953 RepID=UPI0015E83845|nr:DUF5718 family protein [Vibrio albus]